MEVVEKIIDALQSPLDAEYIRIEDDDGISGFVVSRKFERMSAIDRQRLIDTVLRQAPNSLTAEEQRQVLMIAGLTPDEYESVGSLIRVHHVKELADGSLEVVVHGSMSDAEYVREVLGVPTSEPEDLVGSIGVLKKIAVGATGTGSLTREKAMEILSADPHIQLMSMAE